MGQGSTSPTQGAPSGSGKGSTSPVTPSGGGVGVAAPGMENMMAGANGGAPPVTYGDVPTFDPSPLPPSGIPGGGTGVATQGGSYNALNDALRTMPMRAATDMFANGGMGPIGSYSADQLATMASSNPWMNMAAGGLSNPGSINPNLFASLYGAAGQPGAAQQSLSDIASGATLGAGGNPYMDAIIKKSQQDVADQTNQLFAAGGRYGSAAHQGTLADSVASMGDQLRAQNYENERARQMQAAGLISGEQQGRFGLQQGAAQGLAGVQGQNVANRLGAAGQLGQLGQQAYGNRQSNLLGAAGLEQGGQQNILNMIGQLPTIQGNKIFDAQQQMQLGQQLDARSQAQLNDLINRWTQGDMEDWARLGGLLTMGQGAAGNYGTGTSTTQSSKSGGGLGALGGLLSIFSMFSDRRMKADIRPDGTWRYAFGIPSLMGRFRGLMAQDMPREAVHVVNGFLAVIDRRYAPEVVAA